MNSLGLFETLSEERQMQVLNLVSVTNIEDLEQAVQYMEEYGYDLNVYIYNCESILNSNLTGCREQHKLSSIKNHWDQIEPQVYLKSRLLDLNQVNSIPIFYRSKLKISKLL